MSNIKQNIIQDIYQAIDNKINHRQIISFKFDTTNVLYQVVLSILKDDPTLGKALKNCDKFHANNRPILNKILNNCKTVMLQTLNEINAENNNLQIITPYNYGFNNPIITIELTIENTKDRAFTTTL